MKACNPAKRNNRNVTNGTKAFNLFVKQNRKKCARATNKVSDQFEILPFVRNENEEKKNEK